MKYSLFRWGTAVLASLAIAGCGGGGGSTAVTTPTTGTAVNTAISTASAIPANDTSTNSSASFTVLQGAGVPAVSIGSPPKVNFTVFSDGAVKTGLVLSNVRFAIAKLVPGANGNPDEWVSYISTNKTAATGVGPGGSTSPKATAKQATTDGQMSLEEVAAAELVGQLSYNADGYYTYAFKTDFTDPTKTGGVAFEPALTHRIAIQLSYKNAAGATVLVNPYFDFTIVDGKSVTANASQTRKMTDVASCNSCHEKLALHGGGRVDTQYCVMCHNPGTTDPESGNVLTLSTMAHSIHAGRRIKATTGDDYTIWGYRDTKHDYAEVGFPQDLRNCTKCHSASNPATPQGDNWKTVVSQQACLSCHTAKVGGAWESKHVIYATDALVVGAASTTNTKATDLTNAQCVACHKVGSNISPEVVHWNQNEENAAKYKMNIESATLVQSPTVDLVGKVEVKFFLSDPTNGNLKYKLENDSTKFGSLSLYLAYQSMAGQSTATTEFSSYNNGGDKASVTAISGTNDGNNVYTHVITIPKNSETHISSGTARVVSIGQIKEPELETKSLDPRPAVVPAATVNVVAQHTFKDVVLTGTLQPRRVIVSNDKCNDCHGALGTTSGSNTLANAFHNGARNTVESCVICHDVNRASNGNMMTDSSTFNESYQFKRMIHGIHGNSQRTYPFTHGNKAVGNFSKAGTLTTVGSIFADVSIGRNPAFVVKLEGTPLAIGETFESIDALINAAAVTQGYTGTSRQATENYAAEVAWPGVGINCNACHVDNSYKQDLGPLGSVIRKDAGVTDPNGWKVISPKAASCTSCHDSSTAISHVTSFGGSAFGNKTQAQIAASPRETCNDCHASGGFKGVDIVHGQQ